MSSEQAQEFKGWGFYPSYFFRGWSQKSGHAFDMFDLPEVADALYALEPDLIRVEAQHYMFNGPIDDNKSLTPDNIELKPDVIKDLIDQLQLAREHGAADWIISVWSPPVSMKTLGSEYNDAPGVAEGFSDPAWEAQKKAGQVEGKYRGPWRSYLRVDSEQDYVNYYVHVLQRLEEAGCGRPVAVSLQNEPDIYAVKYPGCYYPPHQWRRVNKMLRATLDANGFADVKIAGPDSAGPNKMFTADDRSSWRLTPGYFGGPGWPALKHDPELLRSLDFINIHTYHAGFQQQMRDAMAQFPHLELWQTEWKPIHYGPENKLIPNADPVVISGTHLARDFTQFPVNRWLLWNAFDGRNRDSISSLVKLGSDGQPILTDEYHVYKTIFDVVDPGWYVKHVEADHPALQPDLDNNGNALVVTGLAFVSPEDDRHVVVLINPTESPVEANLSGISGTGDRYTLQSGMEDGPERSSFSTGEAMTLPPLTVTVVVTNKP